MKRRPIAPVAQRFWAKADTTDAAGCWPWLASKTHHGYGKFSLPDRRNTARGWMHAHVMAYLLTHGPLAEAHEVDHLCGRRDCVNPWHLEAVPHIENMRRLRTACPGSYARIVPRGALAAICPNCGRCIGKQGLSQQLNRHAPTGLDGQFDQQVAA